MDGVISLDSLPHLISLYTKVESTLTDSTKRTKSSSYTLSEANVPAFMEPLDTEEIIMLGLEYNKTSYSVFLNVEYKDAADIDDVILYKSKSHVIKKWTVFDFGPLSNQHVEAICEKLPSTPTGVT